MLKRLSVLLSAAGSLWGCVTHRAQHHHGMPHQFADVERWAREFEAPERDAWQKPDVVIEALRLPPDAKVADIGSGTGYFAIRLARAVPQGRVFAADVEPKMTEYLGQRAAREKLENLRALQCEPSDPKLPEPVDLILIVNTYHHLDARADYFSRLRSFVRPGGRVVVVDFTLAAPMGPPPEHRLSAEQVGAELKSAGYVLQRELPLLPHQYVLEFVVGAPPQRAPEHDA